jgi:hypothetical protein
VDAVEGLSKVVEQAVERAVGGGVAAADQDVVPAGAAGLWQDQAGDLAQAALGAGAGDRVADLAGAGEADADLARFAAVACLQDEGGGRLAQGARRAEEVGAVAECRQRGRGRRTGGTGSVAAQALRRLRPRARRALRIWRPDLVDIRERKP